MIGLRRKTPARPKSEAVRDDRGNVVNVHARCRMFTLVRDLDVSGVSGTGVVAEGIEFSDGTAAMRWQTGTASTAVYASIADVVEIHGHGGATRIVWVRP